MVYLVNFYLGAPGLCSDLPQFLTIWLLEGVINPQSLHHLVDDPFHRVACLDFVVYTEGQGGTRRSGGKNFGQEMEEIQSVLRLMYLDPHSVGVEKHKHDMTRDGTKQTK